MGIYHGYPDKSFEVREDGVMADNDKSGCVIHIGLGSVVATVLSVALNHSFWWAVLHFFLGWLYVLYALLFRTKEIWPAIKAMFG